MLTSVHRHFEVELPGDSQGNKPHYRQTCWCGAVKLRVCGNFCDKSALSQRGAALPGCCRVVCVLGVWKQPRQTGGLILSAHATPWNGRCRNTWLDTTLWITLSVLVHQGSPVAANCCSVGPRHLDNSFETGGFVFTLKGRRTVHVFSFNIPVHRANRVLNSKLFFELTHREFVLLEVFLGSNG